MIKERPYTGLTAEVKVNNSVVGYMSGVDLTLEKSIIEIMQFGADFQEKVPAIKNWTASVDGTVAFASGGSQHKLYQAYDNGEAITVGIFLSADVYFEGKAFVSSLNIDGAPDDKMNISCDLEGTGPVSFTLPLLYQVDASSGVGGTITPGGAHNYAAESKVELTIEAATGYVIDSLKDNGAEVKTSIVSNKYTIENIAADHVIVATFKESTT